MIRGRIWILLRRLWISLRPAWFLLRRALISLRPAWISIRAACPRLLRRLAQRAVARELRPQRRGLERLVHDQDVRARGPVADLRASIGGGEDRRRAAPEVLAQRPDRGDAVAGIEMVVGDDDVRRAEFDQRGRRLGEALGGGDHATPPVQKSAHALQHPRLVIDGQNLQPAERFARRDRLGRAGLCARLKRRASERRGDEEHRPLAGARAQSDRMLEHPPQALDDR